MPRLVFAARAAIACAPILALSSCGLFKSVVEAPMNVARAVMPGAPGEKLQPIDTLHPRLMALADNCAQRVSIATELFAEEAKTRQATLQSVRWRLAFSRLIYQTATSPSPLSGLLDMLVLVRTGSVLFQSRGIADIWGPPARHIANGIGTMEATCWQVVGDYIGKAQVQELRVTLDAWQEKKLGAAADEIDELPDFRQIAHALGKNESNSNGGIMSFLSIDPLAGLEPVAREVALTRQFTERMLYWAERMPALIDMQVELGTLEAQKLPEVVAAVGSLERATKAAETIADTAKSLPAQIGPEREAAIRQIGEELDAQRKALVTDLEQASAPVQKLLVESRETIAAGQALSQELTKTVQAVDAMLKRFDKDPNAPKEPEPAQPGKPFDIVEYGEAATRVGAAAAELRGAVTAVDQAMPRMIDAVDRAVDGAFWMGIIAGLVLIAALAAALAFVRRAGLRKG
jgi:hypothetical protein